MRFRPPLIKDVTFPHIRLDRAIEFEALCEQYWRACQLGPPVLLVMGLGTPHVGWQAQLPAFRERYRAVAFDNRGCGRSSFPAGSFTIRGISSAAYADTTSANAGIYVDDYPLYDTWFRFASPSSWAGSSSSPRSS